MEGVTETNECDSGNGGSQSRVDKTGCNSGAGFDEGYQDSGHACEV